MQTNSDEKVFYMKNHLLEKLHPNLMGETPLNIFKILKNLTEKKLRGFKDLEWKKSKKLLVKSGQTVVKLSSNNGQTNYSRILVLLNNYFSYFELWSNLVKLWSNNGQTNYSRNISVTK